MLGGGERDVDAVEAAADEPTAEGC